MKHLLDIKYFLTEALPEEFKKKYRKHFDNRSKKVQERLNKLLDNKERVYIPYNSDTISETQLKVKDYLEEQGYKIMDYKLNSAVQIENSKRTIRISKLLAKEPALLKEFTLDDTRANTRTGAEFSIVLTSNYEDVAGMSFERCWTNSCLDINGGVNKKYVTHEVKQGTIVAYLIKGNDLEIEEPLGRVNIKPFYPLRDENEIIYVIDRKVYGNVPDEKLFKEIINQYLKEKQEVKLVGFYNKVSGLYSDPGSPQIVSIGKDYKVCYSCEYDEEGYDKWGLDKWGYDKEGYDRRGYDKEGYNRQDYDKDGVSKNGDYPYQEHLTRKQYNWLRDNMVSKFHVDEKGLVNVDGGVNIRYKNLTEFPVKFGTVEGDFNCSNNNLTSLEGAPSIVKGHFECSNNNLTSLVGATKEGVTYFDCSNNYLTSLEGSPRKVRDFNCSNNNLTSLVGAPIEVEWGFYCYSNSITSLVGSPSNVGRFNCSYNNLTSLVGAPIEAEWHFDCSNNPNLTSLEGAPKKVEDFDCRLCGQMKGHQFTKKDVQEVSKVRGRTLI